MTQMNSVKHNMLVFYTTRCTRYPQNASIANIGCLMMVNADRALRRGLFLVGISDASIFEH